MTEKEKAPTEIMIFLIIDLFVLRCQSSRYIYLLTNQQ